MRATNNVALYRFIDCEKWRKEFGTDELPRTFEYKEKPKVFEYYPQYYHKTDKVCQTPPLPPPSISPGHMNQQTKLNPSRTAAQSTSNSSARST